MKFQSLKGWIVWNEDGPGVAENRIVLANNNGGVDAIYSLPHPVVVAIDVDGQNPDWPCESGVGNEIVDILGRYERLTSGKVVLPKSTLFRSRSMLATELSKTSPFQLRF
jgi:hypothetical protein